MRQVLSHLFPFFCILILKDINKRKKFAENSENQNTKKMGKYIKYSIRKSKQVFISDLIHLNNFNHTMKSNHAQLTNGLLKHASGKLPQQKKKDFSKDTQIGVDAERYIWEKESSSNTYTISIMAQPCHPAISTEPLDRPYSFLYR